MARIIITDLEDSVDLDRKALSNLKGGLLYVDHCNSYRGYRHKYKRWLCKEQRRKRANLIGFVE